LGLTRAGGGAVRSRCFYFYLLGRWVNVNRLYRIMRPEKPPDIPDFLTASQHYHVFKKQNQNQKTSLEIHLRILTDVNQRVRCLEMKLRVGVDETGRDKINHFYFFFF
jgi:hypothetical protein